MSEAADTSTDSSPENTEGDTDAPSVTAAAHESAWPLVTTEAALAFEEARTVTGRRGARLVMLMGEVGAGKTTVLVELWGQLLGRGSLADIAIAGSRTALAFEKRAFDSRIESDSAEPSQPRTQEEDDGLLHTRVAIPNGTQIELLFTDITGEHFERIREGVPLLKRLPWAERVDRFVVVVDGDDLSKPGTREVATTRSRRLLLALKESGAVAGTARVAVAVTKADKLDASAIEWFAERKVGLLALARELDESVAEFMVAARPEDGTEPTGLDLLLKWICSDDRNVPGPDAALPSYERAFARVRA